jgi:hypothetical protein
MQLVQGNIGTYTTVVVFQVLSCIALSDIGSKVKLEALDLKSTCALIAVTRSNILSREFRRAPILGCGDVPIVLWFCIRNGVLTRVGVVCSAGLKQPCVEVRFDNLCASSLVPAGSSEGLFTVGVDMKVKALVCHRSIAK